jgi:hypothetical protein
MTKSDALLFMPDPKQDRIDRAAACDAAVQEILKSNPGMSYTEAWQRAAQQNPGLFKGEIGDAMNSPATPAKASDIARLKAEVISEVVKATLEERPELSFDECFRMVHAQNRALFEPAGDGAFWSDIRTRAEQISSKLDRLTGRQAKEGAVLVVGIRPQP